VEAILSKIFDYIQEKHDKWKIPTTRTFVCPLCNHPGKTATLLPKAFTIRCTNPKCKDEVGDIIDIVRHFELEKADLSKTEIIKYLSDKYGISYQDKNEVDIVLDFYSANGFDLVPVSHNMKIPIEKAWTTKNHKDISEWKEWLVDDLNIGIKTGKMSGITVIDIDQYPIPEEVMILLGDTSTMYQRTAKGCHFFYKYEPDLPKTRIVDLKIDIENDGGQVIVPPSTVDGKTRQIELFEVQPMPKELKEFLLEKTKNKYTTAPIPDPRASDVLNLDDIDFGASIADGNRHHNFMKFGGLLRKKMNLQEVSYTLAMINKFLCKPALTQIELQNIVNSIDKYTTFDEKELSYKILEYIEKVEDATARDVKEALGYDKQKVDTLISTLVREGYVVKKQRLFKAIKKMKWQDVFMDDGKTLSYKMPYFDDLAIFREGDLIIIGAKTGIGKSHIALNIMRRLVDQKIKPKYVNLESANRFLSIAKKLGLKEGDFNWVVNFSPETMELDDNAFTIIDWLLPDDYAETDKIYKYFSEQLSKHKGILLVFVQLKADGSWFAPNQIEMFPSLAAKFMYDDEHGSASSFTITKIRESKHQERFSKIKTRYCWESRELLTDAEYEERFNKKPPVIDGQVENVDKSSPELF
jgi:hypothetical protein